MAAEESAHPSSSSHALPHLQQHRLPVLVQMRLRLRAVAAHTEDCALVLALQSFSLLFCSLALLSCWWYKYLRN